MPKTIAFDVSGTLVLCELPNPNCLDLYKWFEKNGWDLYIWSGAGIDFASDWARSLGLKGKIVAKGSFVPDIAVDDEDLNLGITNIKMQFRR